MNNQRQLSAKSNRKILGKVANLGHSNAETLPCQTVSCQTLLIVAMVSTNYLPAEHIFPLDHAISIVS